MSDHAALPAAQRGGWASWRVAAAGALLLLLLAGELTGGWVRMAYRFLVAEETLVVLTVDGLYCGTQPDLKTADLQIPAGSRLRIHNHTGYWTVPVLIAAGDSPDARVLVESPPIPQSGEWTHVFWRPGRYYMAVPAHTPALAGLSGWVSVGR